MGFKQSDLVPSLPNGPTPITPVGKDTYEKVFQVARTGTTNVTKQMLPADASVVGVKIYGSTASDAATTATVVITLVNNSGTISTGTADVKASGATTAEVQMSSLPNLETIPLVGDIAVKAVYAETGTASTTGGPWNFAVRYVR